MPAAPAHPRDPIFELETKIEQLNAELAEARAARRALQGIPSRHRFDRDEAFTRWRDGETFRQIAESYNVSTQAIVEGIHRTQPGWMIGLVRDLHATRTRVRNTAKLADQRAAHKATLPLVRCLVCGTLVRTAKKTCGGECSQIWLDMRYHTDPIYRAAHHRLVAARQLRIGSATAHARHVLNGEPVNSQGTWLTPRSSKWASFLTACERGYPIFDRLAPELQAQVRERLEHGEQVEKKCSREGCSNPPQPRRRTCSDDCAKAIRTETFRRINKKRYNK